MQHSEKYKKELDVIKKKYEIEKKIMEQIKSSFE